MPGQRTTGRSLSTGRGATVTALTWRAFLRRSLRPGWEGGLDRFRCLGRVDQVSHLVEVAADTALPVLAEVYNLSVANRGHLHWEGLTVVLDLLIVLDRLSHADRQLAPQ